LISSIILLSFFIFCLCIFLRYDQKPIIGASFDAAFVESFIRKFGGSTLSHLLFLKDKQVFIAQDESVLISYRQKGNKYIVLGDPIGEEVLFESGLDEFIAAVNERRGRVIFYQTSDRFMTYFHDRGYRFFKIGEEAKVCLKSFTIEGKKAAKLRSTINLLEKGMSFRSFIHPLVRIYWKN
jgi:phosphatidylglycerol lysyltransferase